VRLWLTLLSIFVFLLPFAAASTNPDTAELAGKLKAGGHILMIRHALAPGTGDPANFKIGDCATQRNLDDRGREQARDIGNWLRSNGIASARMYSSQWCRCLETARLIDLGPVAELPALNSFYELLQNREPNLKALREFIAAQPEDGKLIIMVTHFVTISAIAGRGVSSGEGVLIKINQDKPYEIVGQLDFNNGS
jgi:phosphohistidine phosphatase SixA